MNGQSIYWDALDLINTSIDLAIDRISSWILSNCFFNSLIIHNVFFFSFFCSVTERKISWITCSQANTHLYIECHEFRTFQFFDRLQGKKCKQMNRFSIQLFLFESLKSWQQRWWWRRSTNIFGLCFEIANLFFFVFMLYRYIRHNKNKIRAV